MSKPPPSALLTRLLRARRAGHLVGDLPAAQRPPSLEAAYAVSAALARGLGGPIAGFKIGATAAGALQALGLGEPFWGPVRAAELLLGPATLLARGAPFEAEPEIALRFGEAIAPGPPVSRSEAVAFIETAAFALEINRPSYRRPFEVGAMGIIADKGANHALAIGPELALDEPLAETAVRLRSSTGDRGAASPRSAGFDPLDIAHFFVNAARAGRVRVARGYWLATGAIGQPVKLAAGDWVEVWRGEEALLRLEVGPLSCA